MGIGIDKVKKALYSICDVLQEEKEELTEIDSRLGDGDMGISMDKGAAAVREVLDAYQETDISKLLSSCGAAFNRAAPSTLGTLLSFSMLAVAKETGKKPEEIRSVFGGCLCRPSLCCPGTVCTCTMCSRSR